MTRASDNLFPKMIFVEGAAPSTPSSGQVYIYAKADGLAYSKDDAGTEKLMSTGGVVFKRTVLLGNGNKTTTSTSFVAVDTTNLAYLTHTLAVGDVVRCTLACQWYNNAAANTRFDFEVDQPTSGNVRIAEGADAGLFLQTNAGDRVSSHVTGLFTATEAGVHGFRPMWMVSTSTANMANATSGADDSAITFICEKLGASA